MTQSCLTTLAHWLAGEFDNHAQAIDRPVWFVQLRLWHRPLPWRIDDHLALFAEQANLLQLDRPYRQRVLVLQPTADSQTVRVQYFAFKQPDRVQGAGANPDLLAALTVDDLEFLPGCVLQATQTASPDLRFKAEPEPGATCCFQYQGQTRQVILGFEASAEQFLSYDRGVDPETGNVLWGAMMGAYEFQKRQTFAHEFI